MSAEQTLRFLLHSSETLVPTLDLRRTLQQVAELVVPTLSDDAGVLLGEAGDLSVASEAHRHPARAGMFHRLLSIAGLRPNAPYGPAAVLRTGRTELLQPVPQDWRGEVASEAAQQAVLNELPVSAAITVPLRVGGRIIGVMGMLRESREYTGQDVALAEEFARRAALAIDHARLTEERLRALREAQRSHALLQGIADEAPAAIFAKDLEGRYIFVNREISRITQLSADQVLGRTDAELFAPEVAHDIRANDVQALSGQAPLVREEELAHDGRARTFLSLKFPLRDDSGSVFALGGVATDITERKRMEQNLRQAGEELERRVLARTAELRQREDELRASLAEKELLLKEVHHRVKNNLQVVISLLRLQSRRLKDTEALGMFEESEARVMAISLVHERLHRESGPGGIRGSDYCRELATKLLQISEAAGQVRCEVEGELSLDLDTAVPFGLIVNELVTNALKHAFTGRGHGVIRVQLHEDEAGARRVSVADDGKGMPADGASRSRATLGLELVQALARQLRGSVSIVSSDAGTEVVVEFRRRG